MGQPGRSGFAGQCFRALDAWSLAQRYNGVGHHFPIPVLRGRISLYKQLPVLLRDGWLNTLKPMGTNFGRFYELHYLVDSRMGYAPLKKGGKWVGSQLGLPKLQPGLQRTWTALPPSMKALGYIPIRLTVLLFHFNGEGDED